MHLKDLQGINPLNRDFADYWMSLPRSDRAPWRADFDPTRIPRLLPRLILYEIQDRSRVHIRLCGTGLVARYGMDVTGRNYLDFVEEGRRDQALFAMLTAAEWPAGMLTRMNVRNSAGRVVQTESLGLPLFGKPVRDGAEPRPMLIFHSIENKSPKHEVYPTGALEHFGVRERSFLDIGAGTPPSLDGETYSEAD